MKWTNGCRSEVAVMVRLARVGLGLLVAGVVVSDVFAPANLTAAAPGDRADYVVVWWTVDGGGVNARQGTALPYVLGGSIGQPDAATWLGNGYVLTGGFWGGDVAEYNIYLPLVLRRT